MSDDFSVSVSIPLDSSGFLRRECPSCERQFKWRPGTEDEEVEPALQYFCPLCGEPAATDAWWTQEQLVYARRAAMPEVEAFLEDTFRGLKNMRFESRGGSSLPEPMVEPDDMVIVEPPCHPSEPLKVSEEDRQRVHCLICGQLFVE